jgi:hypothetical protein
MVALDSFKLNGLIRVIMNRVCGSASSITHVGKSAIFWSFIHSKCQFTLFYLSCQRRSVVGVINFFIFRAVIEILWKKVVIV